MKTISTYISVINSIFWESTLEQTIRQALLFSDEIVIVNSEHTSDGTGELLELLRNEYPNIIKIYTFKESTEFNNLPDKKSFALSKCSMDWCILQDDDEMIHEKYAEYIKMLPSMCPETIAFRFNTIHFYRSYDRYQTKGGWYQRKIYMVKNGNGIKHGLVNTDPDNHVISLSTNNTVRIVPVDSLGSPKVINTPVTSYHYGWCRSDCVLLMKKYNQEIRWWGKDYWKSHEFPFKFEDPEKLPKFEGTHPKSIMHIVERESKFNSKHIKEFTK